MLLFLSASCASLLHQPLAGLHLQPPEEGLLIDCVVEGVVEGLDVAFVALAAEGAEDPLVHDVLRGPLVHHGLTNVAWPGSSSTSSPLYAATDLDRDAVDGALKRRLPWLVINYGISDCNGLAHLLLLLLQLPV